MLSNKGQVYQLAQTKIYVGLGLIFTNLDGAAGFSRKSSILM